MIDIVSLSELSDEPGMREGIAGTLYPVRTSPRLEAVLGHLPANAVRISNALDNLGILTVADLCKLTNDAISRAKNLGPKSREYIDAALACFGLHRVGQDPPLVVRDGASAVEAHVQRLLKWAAERTHAADETDRTLTKRLDANDVVAKDLVVDVVAATEADVLADVMLILDGREPTNRRRWG